MFNIVFNQGEGKLSLSIVLSPNLRELPVRLIRQHTTTQC